MASLSHDAESLAALVTVVVTSSPSCWHPSTQLLEKVFESFKFVDGLYECPRIIVLDGYNVREIPEVKKGRISQAMADNYEEYCVRVMAQFQSSSCRVIKSSSHIGFAFAVKTALEQVQTPYAVIIQHDRVFCKQFTHMPRLLQMMEQYSYIRYIGFPCGSSRTHASQILGRYSLSCFLSAEQRIPIAETYFLQPLLFWFDSNHICHVKRYLEIYTPFISMWPELKTKLGAKRVKKLVLRRGDFIEDRFGQMQRIILTSIIPNEVHTSPTTQFADPPIPRVNTSEPYVDFLLQSFYWFGSYMVWLPTDGPEKISSDHVDTEFSDIFVRHLDGRRRDPVAAVVKRAAGLLIRQQLAASQASSSSTIDREEFHEYDEDPDDDGNVDSTSDDELADSSAYDDAETKSEAIDKNRPKQSLSSGLPRLHHL